MTEEQRLAWEKQQGFTSFATKSNEVYDSILLKEITTLEQLKKDIIPYEKYVTLIKDESGEFTLEMNTYYRKDYYLANSCGILKIEDSIYKFFPDFSIATHFSHFTILNNINSIDDITSENKEVLTIEKKDAIALPKADFYNCGSIKSHEETVTNGRNRTKLTVEIDVNRISQTINGIPVKYDTYEARCEVRAYLRTGGIWFHAKRTLSCDIVVDIIIPSLYNSTTRKERFYFQELGKNEYSISKTWIPQTIYTSDSQIPTFDYIYAWGDTPDTPTAWINCIKL